MTNYQLLYKVIFVYNRKRYSTLSYAWNKLLTIRHLKNKIPDLKTSFIKEIKSIQDIDLSLKRFVLKSSFGHSAINVLLLEKIKDGLYIDKIKKKKYNLILLIKVISKFKQPFIEKVIGNGIIPYDIKVHIFCGRISFFYIYNKGGNMYYEKARYDSNMNYISFYKMFYPNSFRENQKFKESKNIINTVDTNSLKNILDYSITIFNNLENLIYCSIDWLYDPITCEYSFCELTPTPYSLSKPLKPSFIKKHISICKR